MKYILICSVIIQSACEFHPFHAILGEIVLKSHRNRKTLFLKGLIFPLDISSKRTMDVGPENETHVKKDMHSSSASRQRFRHKWNEFVEATTLHGVRYIFVRKRVGIRLLWLAFLLITVGFFLNSASRSVAKYYRHPISTKVSNKFVSSLTFPAVSICPSNVVSKRKIITSDSDDYFKIEGLNLSACTVTEAVRGGSPCGHALLCCCLSIPGQFKGSYFVPHCSNSYQTQLQSALSYSPKSFNKWEFLAKYSQSMKQMLGNNIVCYFGALNASCDYTHFTQEVKEDGTCYTFNSGRPGHPIRKSYDKGAYGGLTIILDLKTDDHVMVNWAQGLRLVVHNQGEFFSIWDGMLVSPGTFASVSISQKKVGNCNALVGLTFLIKVLNISSVQVIEPRYCQPGVLMSKYRIN